MYLDSDITNLGSFNGSKTFDLIADVSLKGYNASFNTKCNKMMEFMNRASNLNPQDNVNFYFFDDNKMFLRAVKNDFEVRGKAWPANITLHLIEFTPRATYDCLTKNTEIRHAPGGMADDLGAAYTILAKAAMKKYHSPLSNHKTVALEGSDYRVPESVQNTPAHEHVGHSANQYGLYANTEAHPEALDENCFHLPSFKGPLP